ncbi:hypothetical protein M9458_042023, partial [Cirrhinus mrigala]
PSTTKSQLAKAESMPESEQDEGVLTKSPKLIDYSLDQTLDAFEPSESDPKTYI